MPFGSYVGANGHAHVVVQENMHVSIKHSHACGKHACACVKRKVHIKHPRVGDDVHVGI